MSRRPHERVASSWWSVVGIVLSCSARRRCGRAADRIPASRASCLLDPRPARRCTSRPWTAATPSRPCSRGGRVAVATLRQLPRRREGGSITVLDATLRARRHAAASSRPAPSPGSSPRPAEALRRPGPAPCSGRTADGVTSLSADGKLVESRRRQATPSAASRLTAYDAAGRAALEACDLGGHSAWSTCATAASPSRCSAEFTPGSRLTAPVSPQETCIPVGCEAVLARIGCRVQPLRGDARSCAESSACSPSRLRSRIASASTSQRCCAR